MSLPQAIIEAIEKSHTWAQLPKSVQSEMLKQLENKPESDHRAFLKMLAQSDHKMQKIDEKEDQANKKILTKLAKDSESLEYKAQREGRTAIEKAARAEEVEQMENLLKDL